MSAFSTLIAAETSVVDYYNFSDARGTGTFGPDFSPVIGSNTMLRYGDDTVDTYQVTSLSDLGYSYINTGLSSSYFSGGEIDYTDNSLLPITSPASWSLEAVFKITDNTNITGIMGLIDNVASNGLSLLHDPAQGFLLYTSSTTTPDAIYANPIGTTFANDYHHVVLIVDDPHIKLYVDNVLAINLTQSLSLDGSSGNETTIGFSYYTGTSGTSFSGIWDEFVTYSKALSGTSITAHYNALFSGLITLQVSTDGFIGILEHHNIDLSFWRGGNATLDFIGNGQFERWRGGISPVLSMSEIGNKIEVYLDGYIFDTVPQKEVVLSGCIQDTMIHEVNLDAFIASDTFVYCDGIVLAGQKRLYPRDSSARTRVIVNRSFPLEP